MDKPEYIGDSEKLYTHLDTLLKSKEKELFLIVPKQVELSQTWRRSENIDD
jgi:hypothetical protein